MSDVLRPYRDLFPQIGQRVMIDDSSVVIGDVRLADDVGIWPLVVIRGDVHYVQIGARTNIQDGSMLHVTHKSSYNPDGNPWRRCHCWSQGDAPRLHHWQSSFGWDGLNFT